MDHNTALIVNPNTSPVPVSVVAGGGGGGLTDAELRAAPVDVNIAGGMVVGLTDAELRASPVGTTVRSKGNSYSAVFRTNARPYNLSHAFGAAGRKQFATIYKLAAQNVRLCLKRVRFRVGSIGVNSTYYVDLMRLNSAPSAGNPIITPDVREGVVGSSTCLALPTNAGNETFRIANYADAQGVTAGLQTRNPPLTEADIVLYESDLHRGMGDPTVERGLDGGFAVVFDTNAAGTQTLFYVTIDYTEE